MYVVIVCFVCNMGQIVNGHLEENIRDVVLHAPIFSEDPNKNLENESSIFSFFICLKINSLVVLGFFKFQN